VHGDVLGADQVVLGPAARVEGRIQTSSLTICEGARFEGDIRMQVDAGAAATAGSQRLAPN
jgi:cytoskeletal protein CcmA (bactofilin family)